MFKLSKKIAVVTGASRGIGKAMAETYAQAGAHVICVSRNEDALNGVADLIRSNGGSASVAVCNVSDLENFQKLIKDTADNYGSVDILVNNAGITRDTLIMRMSEDDWDTVIDINLKG
ncbi:MAG: SDR family NAD(P)-dependent oxidoreductase, partial [Candidatus Marinimicrobia bacterium]|nr:SDR family NAD(P)-dependent oxidoreductase [Candidatus Neomarinimicrobiota bacterium]